MRRAQRANYDPEAAGAKCSQCPLREMKPVPPEGRSDALLVVVGEGPSFQDVKQGRPFIGPPGVKLNEMLTGAGMSRDKVFITNAVLCRSEVPGLQGLRKYEFKTFLAWLRKENARMQKHALTMAAQEIKDIRKWLRSVERQFKNGVALTDEQVEWQKKAQERLATIFVPVPTPLECCAPRLWGELGWFERAAQERHRLLGDRPNGAVVVPLGNYAVQAVTGLTGIMKLRGSPLVVNVAKMSNPQPVVPKQKKVETADA